MDPRTLRQAPRTLWFSKRERQILRGICRRQQNKQIAEDLGIAAGSVKNVVNTLLRKMEGIQDREDLRTWCLQHIDDVERGLTNDPKLHRTPCGCGSLGCEMLAQLDRLGVPIAA
jgi:DNA-binding CsgD family transcriptional regulator